jgi:hypothetical protein
MGVLTFAPFELGGFSVDFLQGQLLEINRTFAQKDPPTKAKVPTFF